MYQPHQLQSTSLDALARSMQSELQRLAIEFSQPSDYLALKTRYAEPDRKFEGLLVKADGTTWNPGSGAGVYVYVGSAWVKL